MPGHVGQNDTDFSLLQEELNAPIFRPLRPNFAIGPPFLTKFGGPQPLNGRDSGEREVGIDKTKLSLKFQPQYIPNLGATPFPRVQARRPQLALSIPTSLSPLPPTV